MFIVSQTSSSRLRHSPTASGLNVLAPHATETVNNVLAQLDRIEREENDMRQRLAQITQTEVTRRSEIEKQNVICCQRVTFEHINILID